MEKQRKVSEDTQLASFFLQPRSLYDEMVPLSITVGLPSSCNLKIHHKYDERAFPQCDSSTCQIYIQYKQTTVSKSCALSPLMQEAFLFVLRWLDLEESWQGKLFTTEGRQNRETPHLVSLLPRKVTAVQHGEKNHQKISLRSHLA